MKLVTSAFCATALLVAIAAPALADNAMSSGTMKSDSMSSGNMSAKSMSSDNMSSGNMSSGNMSSGNMMAGGDNAMMTTMKGGEVIAIMPDGHMGTSMMTGDKMDSTIGMSSAMSHCMMFITGSDGMMHQVDTSSAAAQKECEGIAK